MLTAIGILIFVVGILAAIALHEMGHMVPAKKFGVKVTEYMVGFGPTIWSRTSGDTKYGVKALPFGGYIRMIGMFPPKADGTIRASSTGRLGTLVEQARKESESDVLTEEDRKRTFYKLSVPKKLVVMSSGPFMNLLIAIVLFAVMLIGFGLPKPSLKVDSVTACLPTATATSGDCAAGLDKSPAALAGVQVNDEIQAIGSTRVSSWDEFNTAIRSMTAGETTVTVVRNGSELVLPVMLKTAPRPVLDAKGEPTGEFQERPFLGVGPAFVLERQPIATVPGQIWDLTVRSVQALIGFPAKIVGVTKAAFSDAERDPNGPIGVVGVSRISGDVAAAEMPNTWKIAQLIGIIASVNLFLFLFNMIPLLPLDGGHIAGALWEGARRKLAKMRGLPDPGPVDVAKLLPVAYVVGAILIGVSVLLLYADVVNPVKLG
jgi:membrane-associated protease RseP (regulator of RpoE activity)